MRPARWGVNIAFATVGARVSGEVVAHVFAVGSAAPICQPSVPGEPTALFGIQGGSLCRECRGLLARATWSTTSYGGRRLWAVKYWRPTPTSADFDRAARRGSHDAEGVAATDAAAFDQARTAIEKLVPSDQPIEIERTSEADALEVARERRAEARAKKLSTSSGAQVAEHVYFHHKHYPSWFDRTFTWKTDVARVLRKTPKKVFIEDTFNTYKTPAGVTVLRTYALDRAMLERGVCRGWTWNPSPPPDGNAVAPGWAEVLGVTPPCTLAQAKRAFRAAAKVAHPDSGGTEEKFRRVKAAFDAAAASIGGVG